MWSTPECGICELVLGVQSKRSHRGLYLFKNTYEPRRPPAGDKCTRHHHYPRSDPSLVYRLQVGKFSYPMPLALARCFSSAGQSQVRFCGEIISFTPQNKTANPGVSDSGGGNRFRTEKMWQQENSTDLSMP